ncbi:MAG TPA: peptidase S41, partial [Pseudomonadales bacterium]|nr:peptidase S41 [Pseudomonadales bacterium]
MKRFNRHSLAIALLIFAGSSFATESSEAPADEEKLQPRLPLNELRVFAEVFNRVSEAYVEEIDDRTLLENAIKGMLSQLDPH